VGSFIRAPATEPRPQSASIFRRFPPPSISRSISGASRHSLRGDRDCPTCERLLGPVPPGKREPDRPPRAVRQRPMYRASPGASIPPSPTVLEGSRLTEKPRLTSYGGFCGAAEGTRTLDLLHGKRLIGLQSQQIRAIWSVRMPLFLAAGRGTPRNHATTRVDAPPHDASTTRLSPDRTPRSCSRAHARQDRTNGYRQPPPRPQRRLKREHRLGERRLGADAATGTAVKFY
jgi:hypothetical protein